MAMIQGPPPNQSRVRIFTYRNRSYSRYWGPVATAVGVGVLMSLAILLAAATSATTLHATIIILALGGIRAAALASRMPIR